MDKDKLTKAIFSKKTRDYTFSILFMVIFSLFVMLAIKPSLTTATSLKREEEDLSKVDSVYESKIADISSIQSQIENNREDLYLFDEAVSKYPEVNKMVQDIKTIADKDKLFIKKANIADVNLLKSQKTIDNVRLTIEGKTTFGDLTNFFNDLMSQRRLKLVNHVLINRDLESTGAGQLNVVMSIDGFYL